MGFNMPEPMKSRKNVANSFLVAQDMIKIGISTNYQRRSKDYKNTYYSEADNKSYVYELEKWETDLAIGDLQRFEKELKQEFIHANTQGEYYQKEYYEEIKAWIETWLKKNKSSENTSKEDKTLEKITNKSIRDINAVEKMSKKKKPSKHENKRFIRTDKLITSKASHNIKRLKWVAEAGSEGRSYSELNRKDSIYRQNIKRKTYKGNESLITQDIAYDIKQGMIKEK
jgi:hypothetical protein|tara:strand:- start:221 stop:904 length:684 start_codon:yes stop_codon:yes gene_type:complete